MDRWTVLGVVAAGGVLGSLARLGVVTAFPTHGFPAHGFAAGGFAWATFGINVVGCLLIGVLVVLVVERGGAHRLWRPFLGVGVLGGFTTFSGYVADIQWAVAAGRPGMALVYLAATPGCALVAVFAGVWSTRALVGAR